MKSKKSNYYTRHEIEAFGRMVSGSGDKFVQKNNKSYLREVQIMAQQVVDIVESELVLQTVSMEQRDTEETFMSVYKCVEGIDLEGMYYNLFVKNNEYPSPETCLFVDDGELLLRENRRELMANKYNAAYDDNKLEEQLHNFTGRASPSKKRRII